MLELAVVKEEQRAQENHNIDFAICAIAINVI